MASPRLARQLLELDQRGLVRRLAVAAQHRPAVEDLGDHDAARQLQTAAGVAQLRVLGDAQLNIFRVVREGSA